MNRERAEAHLRLLAELAPAAGDRAHDALSRARLKVTAIDLHGARQDGQSYVGLGEQLAQEDGDQQGQGDVRCDADV